MKYVIPRLTLGLAHELGLMAATTMAFLIILLGGEMPPWMWLTAFAPVLSMALSRREVRVPPIAGTVLGLGAIAVGVMALVQGGLDAAVFAGGTTLMGLTVARVLTRHSLAHDQQALLLSLVLVLTGSVLNVSLSYFVVFVGFAIAAVWALSTRQLLAGAEATGMSARQARARDDVITPLFFAASAGVSLVVLLAAVLIFVSFPRIGFGELGFLGRKGSQLPPSVGFGGSPRGLSTSTQVVARLRGIDPDDFDDGLYLRGIVYDELTFDAFSQSSPDALSASPLDRRANLPSLAQLPDREATYEVTQFPVGGSLLFTLGHTRTAMTLSGGTANPNRAMMIVGHDRHDELRTESPLAGAFRFQVRGSISIPGVVPPPRARAPVLSAGARVRHLRLPPIDAQVEQLRQRFVVAVGSDDDSSDDDDVVAASIRNGLLRGFRYSLNDQVVGVDLPLRHFLITTRAGHCELFAGGYAMLLRMSGIPARVVGGFQGGARADDGSIIFQQRHAHAWVEWWKDGVGWIVDDATPQATATRDRLTGIGALLEQLRVLWDDRVLDYALVDQESALRGISRAIRGKHLGTLFRGGVVVVIAFVVVVVGWRRLRRRRSSKDVGDALARAIVAAVDRVSTTPVPSSATIAEAVAGRTEAVLHEAARLYERHRYGNEALDAVVVDGIIAALRALRRPTESR